MLLAHWGVPLLVVAFVLVYWVLGVLNYANPNIEAMMQTQEEEKDEDTSVWMILGFFGLGSCLLIVCGRFLSPRMIIKVQNMRGKPLGIHTLEGWSMQEILKMRVRKVRYGSTAVFSTVEGK